MIIITENPETEMLKIDYNGKNIFYGNYWDFSIDGETIKKFIESMDLEVELKEELDI